ncbi:MAG: lipopolysaccharide transport periplasmic protein LptA [Methylococcaceae bacterium]
MNRISWFMAWVRGAVLLGGLWVLTAPVQALNNDSSQPIDIEADAATYEERKGETVYSGNVRAAQGSLEVRGDRMVVFDKGGKTEKIVVTGNPSRLKQTPDPDKDDIRGTAQRSEYFPVTGVLILYDQAQVWQGQNSTTSDRIEYDIKNGLFKAGSSGSGHQRVHVRLQPESTSKTTRKNPQK